MARLPYDSALQMLIEPPKQIDDEVVKHLSFLRWMLQEKNDHQDGHIVGESDGLVIDFIREKAEREAAKAAEQTTAA